MAQFVQRSQRKYAGGLVKLGILLPAALAIVLAACPLEPASDNTSGNSSGLTEWAQASMISTAGYSGTPQVAADPAGDVTTAVWVQHDGTQYSVYASRYNGGWGAQQLLESQSDGGYSGGASSPRIAMSTYGRAVVTWTYHDGAYHYSIWSNRYNLGDPEVASAGWQTAQWLGGGSGSGNANSSQVAVDGSGDNILTVWSQYQFGSTQYNYRTTHRQYYFVPCLYSASPIGCLWAPSDFGWRSTTLLDPHDIGDAGEPQVAAWGTRNAVAVWTQNAGWNQIWANTANNGTWSTAERINTGSTYGAAAPVVAVDSSGNAIAVWMEFVPGRTTLYASRLSSGSWSAPIQIDDPSGQNAGDYDPPRQGVAMDNNGNAMIVWQQREASGSEYSIYARWCPAGDLSGVGAPIEIDNGAGYADLPAVAFAPDGDALAVWKQEDGGARRIYANRYSAATNGWQASATLLGGADSTWNEGPQIAVDGNGKATVVWTEYQAGQYNIYAARTQ